MASFNKVILMGNLTRDPELRVPASTGNPLCKLGLAVNRRYRVNNEQREEVTFVDLTAFGKRAEVIAKYCSKGSPILVEGWLKLDQWENQAGEKRSKLQVIVENFQFMGRAEGGEGSGGSGGYESNSPARRDSGDEDSRESPAESEDLDEDVPF